MTKNEANLNAAQQRIIEIMQRRTLHTDRYSLHDTKIEACGTRGAVFATWQVSFDKQHDNVWTRELYMVRVGVRGAVECFDGKVWRKVKYCVPTRYNRMFS